MCLKLFGFGENLCLEQEFKSFYDEKSDSFKDSDYFCKDP